jgi:hypothetical protein
MVPSGATKRRAVTTLTPSRPKAGRIEKREAGERIGHSSSTSSSPWFQTSSVVAGSGRPTTWARAAS